MTILADAPLKDPQSFRERSALKWLGVTVITGSLFPLIVAFYSVQDSPFYFAALTNFWALAFYVVYLLIKRHQVFRADILQSAFNPERKGVRSNVTIVPSIIGAVLIYPLFALATRYVDVVVVAIIFEIWPLFIVLLTGKLFHKEERFKNSPKVSLYSLHSHLLG